MLTPARHFLHPIALLVVLMPASLAAQSEQDIAHARKLLASAPIIDGHNDLPWVIRSSKTAPFDVNAYDLRQHTPGHTDLKRLADGGVGGQFWSVYVPGEVKDSGFARVPARGNRHRAPGDRENIPTSWFSRSPPTRSSAPTGRAGLRACWAWKAGTRSRTRSAHCASYYLLGVRYMTLTHNVTLDWADAALGRATHKGLTPFGERGGARDEPAGDAVRSFARGAGVMSNVLRRLPGAGHLFAFIGASAGGSPRNVPDSILAMQKNGGVVKVKFMPSFVSRRARMGAGTGGGSSRVPESDTRAVKKERDEWMAAPDAEGDNCAGGGPHRAHAEGGRDRPCRHRERF